MFAAQLALSNVNAATVEIHLGIVGSGVGWMSICLVFVDMVHVNSEARKYKTAPLQHRDLLEKLFEGLSATGDFAWSSGMTSVPPSTQQTEYVPLPDDTNIDETQVPHAGVDYPWEGEAIPSYDVPISP
ncbi:hypothetical protein GIB67_038341 [Kingdonia uniflora]|uniref:Uncharacterized protein n=1 Tax=Kingdonia uniflora TaxID=39325 RepID=A0A7J7KUL2_9MAGN|nr:hypothetical protein GIB67_038341 [Kingdonia uniflora]